MGRQLALASQALGRSPYDDVVYGDDEGDERIPLQMYDERGRPVNPETKRINRDVIRSHNEVMLVIGVAEPENGGITDSQIEAGIKQIKYEERIGGNLLRLGRILEQGSVWGVLGLRQRILIYKEYANIPFYELYKYEKARQTPFRPLSTGLPSFFASCALLQLTNPWPVLRKNLFARSALTYIHLHLQLFAFLQRAEIVSPSTWLPGWKFFVPFSETSPIPAPPPLTSLSIGSVLAWVGMAAVNTTPFIALWLFGRSVNRTTAHLRSSIERWVPIPSNGDRWMQFKPAGQNAGEVTAPDAQGADDEQPLNARDMAREEAIVLPLEGPGPAQTTEPTQIGAVRRQSTLSSRGDEYVSEDEETEVVSATLISFDVEATESSDTPPGVWSAELRPNVVGDRSLAKAEPVYRETALTQVPATIATDVLTSVSSLLVTAPLEAIALRLMASSYVASRGLPVDHIYGPSLLGSFSWAVVTSIVGLEVVHLSIGTDLWAMITLLAQNYRIPSEDWYNLRNANAVAAAE